MDLKCEKEEVQENEGTDSLHGNGNMNFIYPSSASEMEWINVAAGCA